MPARPDSDLETRAIWKQVARVRAGASPRIGDNRAALGCGFAFRVGFGVRDGCPVPLWLCPSVPLWRFSMPASSFSLARAVARRATGGLTPRRSPRTLTGAKQCVHGCGGAPAISPTNRWSTNSCDEFGAVNDPPPPSRGFMQRRPRVAVPHSGRITQDAGDPAGWNTCPTIGGLAPWRSRRMLTGPKNVRIVAVNDASRCRQTHGRQMVTMNSG